MQALKRMQAAPPSPTDDSPLVAFTAAWGQQRWQQCSIPVRAGETAVTPVYVMCVCTAERSAVVATSSAYCPYKCRDVCSACSAAMRRPCPLSPRQAALACLRATLLLLPSMARYVGAVPAVLLCLGMALLLRCCSRLFHAACTFCCRPGMPNCPPSRSHAGLPCGVTVTHTVAGGGCLIALLAYTQAHE